jgi:hypothetical protein
MVVRAGSQPTESRDDGQDCRHAGCLMRDDDITTMVRGLLTRWLWRVHSADATKGLRLVISFVSQTHVISLR